MNNTPDCINQPGTLLFAIGNDGRQDDGLGWAFAREVEQLPFPGEIHYRYQLQVEDAALVARARTVLFVDASRESLQEGFAVTGCDPREAVEFTTHALTPASVMAIAEDLYNARPPAYILAISGCNWELERGLSDTARRHLEKALEWFKTHLNGKLNFSI